MPRGYHPHDATKLRLLLSNTPVTLFNIILHISWTEVGMRWNVAQLGSQHQSHDLLVITYVAREAKTNLFSVNVIT